MWLSCDVSLENGQTISDLPLACITLLRLASALARAPANPSRSASWFAGVSLSSTYILWKKVLSLFHASSLHTTKGKFISPDIHLWPLIVVTFPRTRITVHGWHWMTLAVPLTALSCIPALMLDRKSPCASETSGGADSRFVADAEAIHLVSFEDNERSGGRGAEGGGTITPRKAHWNFTFWYDISDPLT